MKNKIVVRMLACLLMSAMLATTVAGGAILSPVTVMAEETSVWTAESQDTNEVEFGAKEDWNTWDNTLKATFNGNNEKIVAGSTLTFTMTIDATAFASMKDTDYIKLQAVFFQAENNWDTVEKLGWPMYDTSKFTQNQDGTYSTAVTMSFEKAVDTFQSVLIQGVGTGFKGKVTISDMEINAPESEAPALVPTAPTVVATFDQSIDNWAAEAGWDYSHGKDNPEKNNPEKNDMTPIEKAAVAWDADTQSLKMTLDYSKDTASGWSEAKVTGHFDAVDVSNYNIITFKLRYPSSMETVRTKLFMKNTDGAGILDAEGSFRSKTVEEGEDGWSTVTIRGEFKPQAKSVDSPSVL